MNNCQAQEILFVEASTEIYLIYNYYVMNK